jgi:hypothetical protein
VIPYWYNARIRRNHDIARLRPPSLPKGRRFETEQDATAYSNVIRAALGSGSGRQKTLASTLLECQQGYNVCACPLCPLCARQYRRWLTGQHIRIASTAALKPKVLTVYLGAYDVGCLSKIDITKSHDALRKRLQRSGLSRAVLVGGTEVNFKASRSQWILHVHLLAIGVTNRTRRQLERKFSGDIPQPVKLQALSNSPKQLSYLQKFSTFHRPGKQRSQRRPRPYPLPVARLRELAMWISCQRFEDFLFLYGARRHGAVIRRTR